MLQAEGASDFNHCAAYLLGPAILLKAQGSPKISASSYSPGIGPLQSPCPL